jgi:predicted Zn-dependent peptidase
VVIERSVSQTSLVLGAGSGFLWADERDQPLNSVALNAFAAGPSSRLFRVVRDELGAAYGITAELPMLAGAARYLVISTSVDPTSAPKALHVIRSEYDRFRQNGLTAAEFEAARARTVNGLEEGARRASAAASLLHGLLRQDRSATEAQGVLERLRKRLTREEVNARLLERWPAPPLTTIIVAPSGDGFAADCVVRRSEEPERCFLER